MRIVPEISDELVTAARAGDPDAQEQLWTLATPWLVSYGRRSNLHEVDAADLADQTLLKAMDSRTNFTPENKARPWIATIFHSYLSAHWRKQSRGPARVELESWHATEMSTAAAAAAAEARSIAERIIAEVLATLPQSHVDAWRLSCDEVAAKHGVTRRTCRNWRRNTRVTICRRLKVGLPEYAEEHQAYCRWLEEEDG